MYQVLATLRLLAMVVWVGGLAFFAFVMAPVAFHVLPSMHDAGAVVGGSLRVFNEITPVCGAVFFLATLYFWFRSGVVSHRRLALQAGLVLLMLIGTTFVQMDVIPAMERDRAEVGGRIDQADASHPAKVDFDRLHNLSEKTEGGILLLGFAVICLMAGEARPTAVAGE